MVRESISPNELEGRAAVITGGAKGIGLAAAKRLAGLGMKICLADNDGDALEKAGEEVSPLVSGENGLRLETVDVSKFEEVERLRDVAYDAFGEVALLMNNAGVGGPRMKPWDGPDVWSRILDVNFWGIAHGVQAFTEAMLAQNSPSAIVNVGSKEGITTPPGNVAYSVSKAGVKVLTEQLAYELRQIEGCKISAHLLVPGWTFTSINSSAPIEEANKPDGAWTADQVAGFMLDGLESGDFYIICQDNSVSRETDEKRIEWAAGDLVENRPALSRWHPEHEDSFARFMED
ncbi:MAG: SDR family NAD(P)-dependent oxidoreductase [Rubrobacter sp.]|jgi:NAD(P)-dependent dehydrogenase (short-subunit alcohol dehydrogenase family)|nr:SDR family NAD(P)-dependent oxidoreductase [Rubrobacter sp.]